MKEEQSKIDYTLNGKKFTRQEFIESVESKYTAGAIYKAENDAQTYATAVILGEWKLYGYHPHE